MAYVSKYKAAKEQGRIKKQREKEAREMKKAAEKAAQRQQAEKNRREAALKKQEEQKAKEAAKKKREEEKKKQEEQRAKDKAARKAAKEAYKARQAEYNAQLKTKRDLWKKEWAESGKKKGQELAEKYTKSYDTYTTDYEKRMAELKAKNDKAAQEYEAARAKAYAEGKDPNAIVRPRKQYSPVSSKEALANLKSSTTSLMGDFVNSIDSSSNNAWKRIKGDREDYMKGYEGIASSSIIGNLLAGFVANSGKTGLSQNDIKKIGTTAELELEQAKFSKKLAEMSIIKMIAMKAYQMSQADRENIKNNFISVTMTEKAYISALIHQTFGNKEFMTKTFDNINKQLSVYVGALTEEKINSFDDRLQSKIDNGFSKIDNKIESTTKKINTKLDLITKIDVVKSLNDKLNVANSIDSFTTRLTSSPVGMVFEPVITAMGTTTKNAFNSFVNSTSIVSSLKKVQAKFVNIQKSLDSFKKKAQERIQQIKNYVTDLKNKAVAKVKEYATKIVADITSKITSALKGAISKGFK